MLSQSQHRRLIKIFHNLNNEQLVGKQIYFKRWNWYILLYLFICLHNVNQIMENLNQFLIN